MTTETATHSPLVTQEQLAAATGYNRAADIRRCLERQGIPVRTGRGGRVWTTLSAIEGRPERPGDSNSVDFA
jgi:hypothetical protein